MLHSLERNYDIENEDKVLGGLKIAFKNSRLIWKIRYN